MGGAVSVLACQRRVRDLLLRYDTTHGDVANAFQGLGMPLALQLQWLTKWHEMDGDCSNLLDLKEFRNACGMADNVWTNRFFSLFDIHFTGSVNLARFIQIAPWLLVYSKHNCIDVAFRLLSRRGTTFDRHSTVLDEKDIRKFVQERYPVLNRSKVQQRSIDIFKSIDDDGSGGIDFDEFAEFCYPPTEVEVEAEAGVEVGQASATQSNRGNEKSNLVFLTIAHVLQHRLRMCFYGKPFWWQETKRLRALMATAETERHDFNTYIRTVVFASEAASRGPEQGHDVSKSLPRPLSLSVHSHSSVYSHTWSNIFKGKWIAYKKMMRTLPSPLATPTNSRPTSARGEKMVAQTENVMEDVVATTGLPDDPYYMTPEERLTYQSVFKELDKDGSGSIDGKEAAPILMRSGLPRSVLFTVWKLSDVEKDGSLNENEWAVALHVIFCVVGKGLPVPQILPRCLVATAWSCYSEATVQSILKNYDEAEAEERQIQLQLQLQQQANNINRNSGGGLMMMTSVTQRTLDTLKRSRGRDNLLHRPPSERMNGNGAITISEGNKLEEEVVVMSDEELASRKFFDRLGKHTGLLERSRGGAPAGGSGGGGGARAGGAGGCYDFKKDFPLLWSKVKTAKAEGQEVKAKEKHNAVEGTARMYRTLLKLLQNDGGSRWKLKRALITWKAGTHPPAEPLLLQQTGQLQVQLQQQGGGGGGGGGGDDVSMTNWTKMTTTMTSADVVVRPTGGVGGLTMTAEQFMTMAGYGGSGGGGGTASSGGLDMHSLLMTKIGNDQPMPDELRDDFEKEYGERLLYAAKHHNVPQLLWPSTSLPPKH